jgi:hypothetical protein
MPADEPPIDFNRSLSALSEEMGVALWRSLFPRIDAAQQKVEGPYVAVIEDRSSLRLDDRYLAAWRGGSLHRTAMNAALDALMTIKLVLEANVLPMTALYPMLRAVIECGSLAVYLLAPADRDERLRRAYWVGEDDARWRSAFNTTQGAEDAPTGTVDAVRAEIREMVAERPSMGNPATFPFTRPTYTAIVTEAGVVLDADPAVAMDSDISLLGWWQLLSGLSHGKQWAFITSLERSDAVLDESDGSAYVRQTSSAALVGLVMLRAVEVLECALRLYGRRSKATWANTEDAFEPAAVSYVDQRRERQARRAGVNPTDIGE